MRYESKRWIFLFSCILMNVCIGSAYAWSVFQKPLIQLNNWTTAEVSLAFTLVMGVSALPMALVGKAQQYVAPKIVIFAGGLLFGLGNFFTGYAKTLTQLYIFYGIIAGMGIGVVYSGGVANLVRFFPDKRGLCSGMLAAGMGLGGLAAAPIAGKLINAYGVMSTFKILGLLYTLVICSFSLKIETAPAGFLPGGWVPSGVSAAAVNGVEKDWKEMLKDPLFYTIAAMFVAGTISGLMIIGHASPILQEIVKLTPQTAAVLVGIVSLANASGRVFWGYISDRLGRFKTMLFLYIICGISMFALTILPANAIFIVAMLVVGICYGGFMGMIASLTADAFGSKNLPINFGIMFLSFGIAAYYGPRIAALVKMANNGDYSQAFITAASISAAGIFLTMIGMYLSKQRMYKEKSYLTAQIE